MAFLGKAKKEDLKLLAEELNEKVTSEMKLVDLKKLITESQNYEEEFVKEQLIVIINERKTREKEVELEREERLKREEQEREERLKREEREFELEKLRIETANKVNASDTVPREETTSHRYTVELQKLIPKFDPKENEISLFLVIFERQAKRFDIDKMEWVPHLMALLPSDIVQLIAREPEEKFSDYEYIKELLLERFKLSPEKFRLKFVQHQKTPQVSWKDFAFELTNFLEEWIKGLEITTFEKLKELLVTDQMKRRVTSEVREHFIDEWSGIVSSSELARKLEAYENVRGKIKKTSGVERAEKEKSKVYQKKPFNVNTATKFPNRPDNEKGNRNEIFDKRRSPQCYECGSTSHLRPLCPKLKQSSNVAKVNRISEIDSEDDYLKPYTTIAKVNGIEMPVLRDTGASIDIICRKYITSDMFTGETVWVQQPLDEGPMCLPVAKVEISGSFGNIATKAAVVRNELDKGRYLLGNRTLSMLSESQVKELGSPCILNAVQTRSKSRKAEEDLSGADDKIGSEADALVDDPGEVEQEIDENSVTPKQTDDGEIVDLPAAISDAHEISLLEIKSEDFVKAQSESPELKPIFELAKEDKKRNKVNPPFIIVNNLLYKIKNDRAGNTRKLLVLPEEYRDRVLTLCHETVAGHLGVTKTKDELSKYFFWPRCYQDAETFVRTCDRCQRAGKPNEKKKLQ